VCQYYNQFLTTQTNAVKKLHTQILLLFGTQPWLSQNLNNIVKKDIITFKRIIKIKS